MSEQNLRNSCEDSEASGSSDSVLTPPQAAQLNPQSEMRLPQESALAIDHIRESIFRQLDRPCLVSCRSVCHSWRYFASVELQKIVKLTFWYSTERENPKDPLSLILVSHDLQPREPYERRTMTELIALLNNSTHFPCTHFQIHDPGSIIPDTQSFFTKHGHLIKKLELFLGHKFDFRFPTYFECLRRLLLLQAPNLEHLILNPSSYYESYTNLEAMKNRNKEYESLQLKSRQHPKPILLNLKVLEIKCWVHENILRQILEISPKLTQVKMKFMENLQLLVQPVNRLHLLKKLKLNMILEENRDKDMNSLETLASYHLGNWAVEKFTFDNDVLFWVAKDASFMSRLTRVTTTILQGCSTGLKMLVWGQLECLEGLEFPQMTLVKNIVLTLNRRCGDLTQFFPRGVSLGKTFPNLEEVRFRRDYDYDTSDIGLSSLFHELQPVQSVKRVVVSNLFRDTECFQEIFPNAAILQYVARSYE